MKCKITKPALGKYMKGSLNNVPYKNWFWKHYQYIKGPMAFNREQPYIINFIWASYCARKPCTWN
jgi:hypothetical protein